MTVNLSKFKRINSSTDHKHVDMHKPKRIICWNAQIHTQTECSSDNKFNMKTLSFWKWKEQFKNCSSMRKTLTVERSWALLNPGYPTIIT